MQLSIILFISYNISNFETFRLRKARFPRECRAKETHEHSLHGRVYPREVLGYYTSVFLMVLREALALDPMGRPPVPF